jgi:hypothetical protein
MPDKGLFALFALAGFCSIILLKTATAFPSLAVAIIGIGAMVSYGLLAWRLPAVQIRPDRLGDNFYYIGFIYTLASLSAALLQIRSGDQIGELLGNFGIALATTVVGVAGRVLFVQMRGELDDVEAKVRRDLAATSADLRGQLMLALRDFEVFRTGVFQASSEAIQKATEQAHTTIATIAAAGADAVNSAGQDAKRQAELMSQMMMRVNQALADLPALGNVDLPSERLEKRLAALTEELAAIVRQLEAITGLVQKRAGTRRRRWYWLYLR